MATWNLKQAKDHLSAILDRVLEGEPQEIVRRGDPPVVLVAKHALTPDEPGAVLAALTKHADLRFDIPVERTTHRRTFDL